MSIIKDQLDYLDGKTIHNPIQTLQEAVDEARLPSSSEPSLSHPDNLSMVKIRDDAIIDIFAHNHQGIRIDPNEQTINVFTNNMLEHLGSRRTWISRNMKTEVAGGVHIVNHAVVRVDSKGDVIVVTNGNVRISAKGNVDVKCGGNATINAGQNITLKAGREITLIAGKHIHFTAPRYDFD